MSIIIKGLDMPTKGNPLTVLVYPDGTATWKDNEYEAVEVPPHGDLIDRDAILSFIDAGHLSNPATKSWSDTEVVDMLESRPTVLEAEGNDES